MRALILAAGDGGRLYPMTSDVPKPLLVLNGRPIISHVFDALCSAGVSEVTIVLGYRGEQVRATLEDRSCGPRLRFIENEAFELGNARSIWAARHAFHEPFLLAMADHVVESALVHKVLTGANDRCRLAIDYAAVDDPRADEATRALVRDGRVIDLGKEIDDWNALDTGVFYCTPRIFDVMTPHFRDGEAGAVFAQLARNGELDAVDVTGLAWIDIDTADDLGRAELVLADIPARREEVG